MKTALYVGTFDPITKGHEAIIEKSLSIFDNVHVVVAKGQGKTPMFSVEERVEMVRRSGSGKHLVTTSPGLTASFAKELGATFLVRGLRPLGDFEREYQMSEANKLLNPDLDTIFLTTEHKSISSTLVREVLNHGGDVSMWVPPIVFTHASDLEFFKEGKSALDRLDFPVKTYFDLRERQSKLPYHNWNHVKQVWNYWNKAASSYSNRVIGYLASIFHDAVYTPGRKTNEEDSCTLLWDCAPLRDCAPWIPRLVEEYIMSTRTHTAPEVSEDISGIQQFVDADLSILAASREEYDMYRLGIQEEYNASFSPYAFSSGRRSWIEGMLSRNKIFLKAPIDMEIRARRNLEWELEGLIRNGC